MHTLEAPRSLSSSQLRLRRALAVAAPLVLGAALLLLHLRPPSGNVYPGCPLYQVSGVYCPGCGSTRSLAALSRGDAALAFRQNPLVMLSLPYLGWAWLRACAATASVHVRGARFLSRLGGLSVLLLAPSKPRPRLVVSVLVLVLVWFLVRNLPGMELLRPLP